MRGSVSRMACRAVRRAYRVGGGGGRGFRVWVPWTVAAVLAAGMYGAALSQDAPLSDVRISFEADRPVMTVGDVVTLTLEVTHPSDHTVVVSRLSREWGPFEVREQTPAQTVSNGDGTKTTRQQLRVTLFALDTFRTPDLPISVRSPDGSIEQVFPFPVELTVSPTLGGTDELLKDIRDPADLSTPLLEQPAARTSLALIGLGALCAVGYLLYRRFRGRAGPSGREESSLPVIDTRTPWEIAIEEIDRIERLDLPEEGRFKEHYTLVADVMRMYVQAMYLGDMSPLDALDMTTDEIGAALRRSSLDHEAVGLAVALLQEADLVKFAAFRPPVSQAYEASGQARYIVEVTMPSFGDAPSRNGAYAQREVMA